MKTILSLLLVILLFSCKKEDAPLSKDKQFLTFTLHFGKDSLPLTITDSTIEGILPDSSRESLMVTFTYLGSKVVIGSLDLKPGDFIDDLPVPVKITILAENGTSRNYTLKLRQFTGIQILYITSPPVTSKEIYVDGKLDFEGNLDYPDASYKMQIRGRGNSTWLGQKKPFKIKFADKVSMFGFPADKEWALLANLYDKSLLRNDVAFELSERLHAAWTPKRRFVEVFLNGKYNGNYLLTETIKQADDRVAIDKKNGGYLTEVNFKEQDAGDVRFWAKTKPWDIPVDIKEVGSATPASIKDEFDSLAYKAEHGMFDPASGYQKNFDLDAYVTWYIVNELLLNNDAQFYSSTYLQKNNATSKLKMGPVWDFDASSGNYNYATVEEKAPTSSRLRYGVITGYIYADPAFKVALKAKWNAYKPAIMSLPAYIQAQANKLKPSAAKNYTVWDINAWYSNIYQYFGSYEGEVAFFKDWMTKRIEWMDKDVNK